MITLAFKN